MNYDELKELMHEYRMERISKSEMALAIGLWQRKQFGKIA